MTVAMSNGFKVRFVSGVIYKIIPQILFNIRSKMQVLACTHLDIRKLALDLSIHFFMPHNVKQKDEQSLKQWTRK